jgi:3-isopropylmalate/(R)-2-methylmalate dehydratase large subunit
MTDFFYRHLAKASKQKRVTPGQSISLKFDLALAHDGSGAQILNKINGNGRTLSSTSRILFTLDHSFPAPTIKDREFQRDIAVFARENDIHLFKNGEGVLHQVVAEKESLWPGMIIVGADGHVATQGAFGAIAFSLSADEFVEAIYTGSHKITVPEQAIISLDGDLKKPAMARDIAMHIVHHHYETIKNKAVLLTGSTIDQLNISEKMSVCNFLPEAGVVTALILPQGEQEKQDIIIRSEEITPMIAVPGNPALFTHPASLSPEQITVAIAGGCSSGRLDDMKIIAEILAKNEVHPDVTFIITPGSRNVMESMDKLHISTVMRNGGAVIMPPGCGPCPGMHFGVLCDTDIAITTTVRNSPGRIGAEGAKIYLASPLTVALSAVNGRITVPQ